MEGIKYSQHNLTRNINTRSHNLDQNKKGKINLMIPPFMFLDFVLLRG